MFKGLGNETIGFWMRWWLFGIKTRNSAWNKER